MPKTTPAVYGLSVSATHVAAVRLARADYALEGFVTKLIAPGILSVDGRVIHDADRLQSLIKDLLIELGNPVFETPVYLTVLPAYLCTREFNQLQTDNLEQTLHQLAVEEGCLTGQQDTEAVTLASLLWQHGQSACISYSGMAVPVLQQYINIFYKAGYRLAGLDILPFAVLRTMAATGVLDGMLARYGQDFAWACIGVTGAQTWQTIWVGNQLQYVNSFITPATQDAWQTALLAPFQHLTGLATPKVWLVWQEPKIQAPIDPMQLNLGASVRVAQMGSLYRQQGYRNPSMGALGAALCADIAFPMGWDFLSHPEIQPDHHETRHIPYHNYQPVLPKFICQAAILLFLIVVALTVFFGIQVKQQSDKLLLLEGDASARLERLSHQNLAMSRFINRVHDVTIPDVQLRMIDVKPDGHVTIQGQAFTMAFVQKYRTTLTMPWHNQPPLLQITKADIRTGASAADNPLSPLDFTFTGSAPSLQVVRASQ